MPEQDHMDRLLSRALSSPVPALSTDFEQQLTQRLRPRRLSAQRRVALILYGVSAIVTSVWTMRLASIEWSMVAASVVVPLIVVAVVFRHYVLRPALEG